MAKKFEIRNSTAEFLTFVAEGKEQGIQVLYKDETVWATQKAMAVLFDCSTDNIGLHLKNIYDTNELNKKATTEKISVVQQEGAREVRRNTLFYNLDAIISVGYRVNSIRATQFRQWCTYVIRQFSLRGYIIDKKRMENGSFIGVAQMLADTTGMDLEEARSSITVSTTAYAWENFGLYDTTTRMLVVYEAPDYVKEELQEANVQLEQKPIGVDALVFIVNEDNPVQALSRQQLRDIYAGKITNWKDVGGKDQAIVAFQRGEDSGSQTLFKKLLIQGGELMTPPSELAPAEMGELVDSIADYNNSANAIGFMA